MPSRNVRRRLGGLQRRARQLLSDADLGTLPLWQALILGLLRGLGTILREATEGQLALRAMSLVYTTLLSVVPLLALSFSVLKAFGAHNAVEPFLLNLLEPLGEQGAEVARNVVGFVDNMRVGVLGFVGLIFLVYTVIALVQKIEQAFNDIWRIEGTRSLGQRFSNYLSVIMVGPLLVVSALGATATLMSSALMQRITSVEPLGTLFETASSMLPIGLIVAAFVFIYMFVPNTRVRFLPALAGAILAGVLWQVVGRVFAALVAGSTRFDAIYSGFAILIMLLIWIYLAWLILLIGANIAFYFQHPEYIRVRGDRARVSCSMRERLGLHLMIEVAGHFVEGTPAPGVDEIARRLGVPGRMLAGTAAALESGGLLVRTGEDRSRLLPGRDLASIPVNEVFRILRAEEGGEAPYHGPRGASPVDALVFRLERARAEALGNLTLRDLLTSESPEAEASELQQPGLPVGGGRGA